jgi:hypothetical protein
MLEVLVAFGIGSWLGLSAGFLLGLAWKFRRLERQGEL